MYQEYFASRYAKWDQEGIGRLADQAQNSELRDCFDAVVNYCHCWAFVDWIERNDYFVVVAVAVDLIGIVGLVRVVVDWKVVDYFDC